MRRDVRGRIKTCTILKEINRWYVCISTEVIFQTLKNQKHEKPVVGVDVGLEKLVTLSDGIIFENPRCLTNSENRLKKLHRNLCKKKRRSKNRAKARIMLAKM